MTSKVTQEEIESAAENLLQEGYHIASIFAPQIRKITKKGSFTTITALLDVWKNERLDQHVIEEPVPLDVSQIMEKAVDQTWHKALTKSREYFNSQLVDKDQLEVENNYLKDENKEMQAEIENIQIKLDQNNKRFATVIEACKEGFFTQAGILRTVIESDNPDAVGSYFEEFYLAQKELLAGALDNQHQIINDHINNLQSSAISEPSTTNDTVKIDLETAAKQGPEILEAVKKSDEQHKNL